MLRYPGRQIEALCSAERSDIHSGVGDSPVFGPVPAAADGAPAREVIRQKALLTASIPGSHALKQGAGDQEKVARLELGLKREAHIVPAGENVVRGFHVGFV